MILLIEGADLVGKSTLAERFASTYVWPIVKIRWALLGDPEIETRAMATATIEILRATQPDVIFDRCYFSWWAYGPALGYDVSYMPELIAKFRSVGDARLILLTSSEEEIRRRYSQEPKHRFPLDAILAANARFPSLLPLVPATLLSIHLDTTTMSPDDLFTKARFFLSDK